MFLHLMLVLFILVLACFYPAWFSLAAALLCFLHIAVHASRPIITCKESQENKKFKVPSEMSLLDQ